MKRTEVPTILVAVYGTLRQGFGNWNYYLNNGDSEYLGEFKTEPKYSMYSLGGFPAVQENGNTSITVEVFKVTPNVKQGLDGLEGHVSKGYSGNFYDVTSIETPFGEATMYIINNRSFDDSRLVESGDWKTVSRW